MKILMLFLILIPALSGALLPVFRMKRKGNLIYTGAALLVSLVLAFVLSSLSPSDLFPAYLRKEWVQPYALKALPVTLVWLKLSYEMLTKNYQRIS